MTSACPCGILASVGVLLPGFCPLSLTSDCCLPGFGFGFIVQTVSPQSLDPEATEGVTH